MKYEIYAKLKATGEFAKVDPCDEDDKLIDFVNCNIWGGYDYDWVERHVLPGGYFMTRKEAEKYVQELKDLADFDDDSETKFDVSTIEIRESQGEAPNAAKFAELEKIENDLQNAVQRLYDFACSVGLDHIADALDWGCGRDVEGLAEDFEIIRDKLAEQLPFLDK